MKLYFTLLCYPLAAYLWVSVFECLYYSKPRARMSTWDKAKARSYATIMRCAALVLGVLAFALTAWIVLFHLGKV